MRKARLLLLVGLLSSWSVINAADYYTKHKDADKRGEATEDHALVYVFRPASVGAAIKTWAFADEQLLMVSKPRAYSFALVPEGERVFWGKAENTSGLELTLEGGKTYYLKLGIRMGFGKARVALQEIDAAEAEKYLRKCSYVEPTPEGRARAVEIAANRMDRAKNKAEERKIEEATKKDDRP